MSLTEEYTKGGIEELSLIVGDGEGVVNAQEKVTEQNKCCYNGKL